MSGPVVQIEAQGGIGCANPCEDVGIAVVIHVADGNDANAGLVESRDAGPDFGKCARALVPKPEDLRGCTHDVRRAVAVHVRPEQWRAVRGKCGPVDRDFCKGWAGPATVAQQPRDAVFVKEQIKAPVAIEIRRRGGSAGSSSRPSPLKSPQTGLKTPLPTTTELLLSGGSGVDQAAPVPLRFTRALR